MLCCCRVLRWRDAEPGGGGERRRCSFSHDPSLPPTWGRGRRHKLLSGSSGDTDDVMTYLCHPSLTATSFSLRCDVVADCCCHGNPSSSSSFAASELRPSLPSSYLQSHDTGDTRLQAQVMLINKVYYYYYMRCTSFATCFIYIVVVVHKF